MVRSGRGDGVSARSKCSRRRRDGGAAGLGVMRRVLFGGHGPRTPVPIILRPLEEEGSVSSELGLFSSLACQISRFVCLFYRHLAGSIFRSMNY